ncbi:MAG: alkaline phosphatase family protein [Rhodothermales bacterium]|nr:alkaline phosphatase family protein [Rhodothermales bacterium]MBO6781498.1 alkaline phosphatase family protein [Rhodothermales bacterium]
MQLIGPLFALVLLAWAPYAATNPAAGPSDTAAAAALAPRGEHVLAWAPYAATTPAPTDDPRVLLIGLDGVRPDRLAHAQTPNIDALAARGFYSPIAQTRMPTVSGPAWSSMTGGVWSEKHGVLGNDFSENRYEEYPDFLTRLEQLDADRWNTLAVLDWPPLGTTNAGGPMISDTVDTKVIINGDVIGYPEADARSCNAAEALLATQEVHAAFVYLGNIDVAGHNTSSFSAEYTEAIEWADGCVGRLAEALAGRPDSEDWLILMSTDHGRTPEGGHGGDSPEELTIFYLAAGAAANPEEKRVPTTVDVAVTALTHLGVAIDPAWKLDGRAIGLRAGQ